MQQGRWMGDRLEVRLVVQDEEPVGDVGKRGEGVPAEDRDLLRMDYQREGQGADEDEIERGKDAPRPPPPEREDVDTSAIAPLGEELRGDEEATEDEEDV